MVDVETTANALLFAPAFLVIAYLTSEIPGIDYDFGEMYTGRIPVDPSDPSRKMFFIFKPKQDGPPIDEITIWFNGRCKFTP